MTFLLFCCDSHGRWSSSRECAPPLRRSSGSMPLSCKDRGDEKAKRSNLVFNEGLLGSAVGVAGSTSSPCDEFNASSESVSAAGVSARDCKGTLEELLNPSCFNNCSMSLSALRDVNRKQIQSFRTRASRLWATLQWLASQLPLLCASSCDKC